MFDYIKSKIAENNNNVFGDNIDTPEFDEDSAIVEYAHIFQELDDISVEGEDSNRDRSLAIDIPIEDDLEIESIEFNISDGRLTDIPMDATVQEYAQYDKMKQYDDFVQEAFNITQQYPRESEQAYYNRITGIADKNFNEYQNMCIQEGMFGFGMININDARVPASLYCDFGKVDGDKNYCVRLDIYFVTDKKHRISKKQLDAIQAFASSEPTLWIAGPLYNALKNKYQREMEEVKSEKDVWDVAKPTAIYVPEQTTKNFEVFIGFDISFREKDEGDYIMTWTKNPTAGSSGSKGKTDKSIRRVNTTKFKSKRSIIRESYELKMKRRPSRFGDNMIVQEAIDFGDAPETDTNPPSMDAGNVEPTVGGGDDMNNTQQPTTDGGDMNTTEPTVDGDDIDMTNADNNGTTPDADAVPVDTNDVSDQIADKVANEQQPDSTSIGNDFDMGDTSGDDDLNIDDDGTESTPEEDGDDTDIDEKIGELDSMSNDDDFESSGMDNSIDVENMTIDELIQQGSEKLKGMTIQQIKDFISQNTPEQVQEAFILTRHNINNELLNTLKESLLILNDSEKDAKTLLAEFKKTGKKLNRVLSKAGRSTKVYNEEEIEHIKKLNRCLVDLITTMKDKVTDESYVNTIKSLIKAFVSQSVVVNKFCEDRLPDKDKNKSNKPMMQMKRK